MYTNLFPRFKVVEINNSTAQRMGHILAQFPAPKATIAHKTIAGYNEKGETANTDVLENGVIVVLNEKGEIVNANASETWGQECLVMNDEIVTSPLEGLDQYCEVFENDVVYPRVLPLYIGDSFTTNNYTGVESGAKFAKVVNGVLTLESSASADTRFAAVASKLPAGQKAFQFTYVGKVVLA